MRTPSTCSARRLCRGRQASPWLQFLAQAKQLSGSRGHGRCRPTALIAALVALRLAIQFLAPGLSAADPPVILATTTSTQDSGLLDVLVPMFEKQTGYSVKTVAVGSGAALKLGAEGNADVVLAHAAVLELEYLKMGSLSDRRIVMHNDFVLVGPPPDPAGLRRRTIGPAVIAFRQIAQTRSRFVSRGDHSGTHLKEQELWKAAGVVPAGEWYVESGQGMGATLMMASEKRGYTLTDRGTYLAFRKRVDLAIVLEGDPTLKNVYHVLRPDPTRVHHVNVGGGRAFEDFLVSARAQAVIKSFGVEAYGGPLFFPDAGNPDPD